MSDQKEDNNLMRYASLATQWMVMLLVAVWVGYKLDHWIGWRVPLFLILLPLVSLCVSLWQLIKTFTKQNK